MAALIANIIAILATKFLTLYWERITLEDSVRYKIYKEMEVTVERANGWYKTAVRDPSRAAKLGLQHLDESKGLRLPSIGSKT